MKMKVDASLILGVCESSNTMRAAHAKLGQFIDGNHFNNKLENLRIVCPNCHSQTTTNSGKKNKNP
jgi:5-methylcytosine-specific restriction endonuclease McrA